MLVVLAEIIMDSNDVQPENAPKVTTLPSSNISMLSMDLMPLEITKDFKEELFENARVLIDSWFPIKTSDSTSDI